MTERLYQRDSYLKAFDARVTATRPDGVILDRTSFFPAGGGVLGDGHADRAGRPGVSRRRDSGREREVLHRLDRGGLAVGDAVRGEPDWTRRYLLMRYHTATHVLTGVMFRTIRCA
jgi:misacylated tRNA(Ala) deacylase